MNLNHNSRVWKNLAMVTALAPVLVALLVTCAGAQVEKPVMTGSEDNPLTSVKDAYEFSSLEGDFRVTWPSGCANVRTRSRLEDGSAGDRSDSEYPVIVTCERDGEKGEGCSVTAIFNISSKSGGPVGPGEVIPRLQKMLQRLGAQVQKQAPLNKDFGDGLIAEGIDIQAAQPQGSGQVWLRGLIVGSEVYILSAWSLEGNVWDNPEYMTFFNSFLPGAD